MDYTRCRRCKSKIKHFNEEYFFFCTKECKTIQLAEGLERRKKEGLKHNPPARRGEIDNTNEIIKQMLLRKDEYDSDVDGKPKGKRKCGKCGERGHNARTCKKG